MALDVLIAGAKLVQALNSDPSAEVFAKNNSEYVANMFSDVTEIGRTLDANESNYFTHIVNNTSKIYVGVEKITELPVSSPIESDLFEMGAVLKAILPRKTKYIESGNIKPKTTRIFGGESNSLPPKWLYSSNSNSKNGNNKFYRTLHKVPKDRLYKDNNSYKIPVFSKNRVRL